MKEKREDKVTVYELGYLISPTISEDKVVVETDSIKKILNDAGANIISDGLPYRQAIAYTIRKKTVGGSYDNYDQAYFGWIKFEVDSLSIESIKKAVDVLPSIIRTLIVVTVKENTYLGKHAPVINSKESSESDLEKIPSTSTDSPENLGAPATIEEIDKSIDAMVKE